MSWNATRGLGHALIFFLGVGCRDAGASEPDEERQHHAVTAVSAVSGAEAEIEAFRPPSPIAAPSLSDWKPRLEALGPAHRDKPYRGFDVLAVATGFDRPIFQGWRKRPSISGRTFRGSAISARSIGRPCFDRKRRGTWYAISTPGHYICSASGYLIKEKNGWLTDQLDPQMDRPLPFRYARVTKDGVPRLKRLPENEAELKLVLEHDGGEAPDWFDEVMVGDYFLALDHEVEVLGEKFYRTVRGEFVRSSVLDLKSTPPLVGEHLDEGESMPLAFIYGDEPVILKCRDDGTWETCGQAYEYDRMQVAGTREIGGRDYVVGVKGYAAPAERVRIARKRKRPAAVGEDEKWIHIALDTQALVAYEGDDPVFVTLVSSGKEGYETPDGLYRVQRKYTTKIMRGRDKDNGRIYHIEDIPWIMYYYGAYALHGAYWHDTFGNVRSHGCTNISPADARWLFHWADPEVRWGWHARFVRDGTYILFES